ncbi:uncharacterized protein LOC120350676 [Nilaparvata lugens]|uniref:uncharacterized protein LOC120350676 n=1 Tax=Nilaparvata lugens TaxID=108931 RepID=UPI00193DBD25|nr:uncharacterized protein LOC120350676 [Nilaparvata lugens]
MSEREFNLTMFEVIDVLTGVVPALTGILMMNCICFRLYGIRYLNLLFDTRLLSFGTTDDREIVRKNIKKSNMFIFIYMGPVYSNLVFWLIRPLLSNDKSIFNTIKNGTEIIYKIVDCRYPFDNTVSPTYYYISFYEIFGVYQIITLMLVTDIMFGSMILVFCGHLEVLKFNIDKLKMDKVQINHDGHGNSKLEMERNLKSVIKNHQKLIR